MKKRGWGRCRAQIKTGGPQPHFLFGAQKDSFRTQLEEHVLRSASIVVEDKKRTRNFSSLKDLRKCAASSSNVIKMLVVLRNHLDDKTKRITFGKPQSDFWSNAYSPVSKPPQ